MNSVEVGNVLLGKMIGYFIIYWKMCSRIAKVLKNKNISVPHVFN